jgi:hypothetical protein
MGVQPAVSTLSAVPLSRYKLRADELISTYMTVVAFLGLGAVAWACSSLHAGWWGVMLFMALGVLSEIFSVTLFTTNRDHQISVSWMTALAGIVVLGPAAGVLIHAANGGATALVAALRHRDGGGQQGWSDQAGFTVGVFALSVAVAGWTYQAAGGRPGQVILPGNLLPLLLMAGGYALVNQGLLLVAEHPQGNSPALVLWRPASVPDVLITMGGGVVGAGALAVAYSLLGALGALVFFLPILSVLALSHSFRLYRTNMRSVVNRLEDVNRNLDEANMGLLEALGAVIDAYDLYTYGHSRQVAVYAAAIAAKTRLTPAEQAAVVKAAYVHDIGKVSVKDSIIGKQGPLTDEEFDSVKRHPLIGAEIVAQMPGLRPLAPLVEYHHERWDGRGYPHGLAGEQLPLGARVLALADSLDAMCSDRPYRSPRALSAVVDEVKACAGCQFDPEVVNAFLQVVAEQDPGFFRNSATNVDRSVTVAGSANAGTAMRYLKKSMVGSLR